MKTKNMLAVADAIEKALTAKKVAVGFNMHGWKSTTSKDQTGHNCGTTACIAGWAYLVAGHTPKQLSKASSNEIVRTARIFLGLNMVEREHLFIPVCERDAITPQSAIATLRLAAVTKRIEWVVPR